MRVLHRSIAVVALLAVPVHAQIPETPGGASGANLSLESTAQPAAAQACGCTAPGDPAFETGSVWQGAGTPGLPEIASLLAPILWFSSDEPLLFESLGPLPHPHPCDPVQRGPVVYYQLSEVRLRGTSRLTSPAGDDSAFWDKVNRLAIRYFFYYEEDRGLAAHPHDLEVAEIEAALENTADGCHRIRVTRATGFAHDLDWYYNELEIQEDTRFPLTFLVEEGKHASCPDRNADGVYTPGYDVNRRVNDAWGVRDVFGSGVLGSPGFEASMAKPRESSFRVVPREHPLACGDVRNSSYARSREFLARYELRPANKIVACDGIEPEGELLLSMMKKHRFGSDYEPRQRPAWNFGDLAEPLAYTTSWLPPVSLRRDRSLGVGFTPTAMGLGQFGYLAARINWIPGIGDVSVEGMITPSAARFFSWYATAGAAWERELSEIEVLGSTYPVYVNPEWRMVTEVGIKFRARVSGKWRVLSLGYHFAGVRIGIRNSGLDDLENSRLIIELGAGVF